MLKEFFGNNYEKAKRNYELTVSREKLRFQRKYPYANVDDFIFHADIARNGDVVGVSTKYKKDKSDYIYNFDTKTNCIGNLEFGDRMKLSKNSS